MSNWFIETLRCTCTRYPLLLVLAGQLTEWTATQTALARPNQSSKMQGGPCQWCRLQSLSPQQCHLCRRCFNNMVNTSIFLYNCCNQPSMHSGNNAIQWIVDDAQHPKVQSKSSNENHPTACCSTLSWPNRSNSRAGTTTSGKPRHRHMDRNSVPAVKQSLPSKQREQTNWSTKKT